MVRLLGLVFLLPFSLAAHIHGVAESRSIQKRPSVDVRDQQQKQQNSQVVRLPVNRRPPKFTTTPPTITRHRDAKAELALHHSSSLRHTSTSSSAKSTATPISSNTTVYFKDAAYGIPLWIGSYPQLVILDFDTGSSETWVSPPCTGLASFPEYEDLCRSLGTYVPEQSSSVEESPCDPSWIMYGSGSVSIKYYIDDIIFGDPFATSADGWITAQPTLSKVQFGLATDSSNMPSGIFGAAYGGGFNQKYPAVIDEMYSQGLIASKDFSVALGSIGEEDGEVVFGGIDLAKFSGSLHEIEISHQLPKNEDGYYRYWINVTSIGITVPGSCVTVPLLPKGFTDRFLPDTGTSLTYMPYEAFNGILAAFPDVQMSMDFGYVVNCSHRVRDGTIDYTFVGGFTVHVPYSDFIFVIPPGPTSGPEEICIIGAVPTSSLFILGDTFLRAVYAVFSQEHHKIYLGKYEDCGSNVVPSRGEKNKGLKGACPEEGRDSLKARDDHYGYPTTSAPAPGGSCTSYSTAPHPKSTSSKSSKDVFRTEEAGGPRLLRPMIQTGSGPDLDSPATPTPVRSVLGPPWSGNSTTLIHGTATGVSGHVGSSGFHPLPTGFSSLGNFSKATFAPVTRSNSSIPGTTATFKKSSSTTSSTRIDVPTSISSSKTFSWATAKSSFLTPFPKPTSPSSSSSSCVGPSSSSFGKEKTSLTTDWLTVTPITPLSPTGFPSWWTTTPSSTSTAEVVTIPVEPHETIVVRLQSTTYTIVDGVTLSRSTLSDDPSSWYSSFTKHLSDKTTTTSTTDTWDTSISWETFTWTKISSSYYDSDSSTTSSTKKKKTHHTTSTTTSSRSRTRSTSSPTSSTHHHHKHTTTTTIASSSTTTPWDWGSGSSSIVSSTEMGPDKYLTWASWDPSATDNSDPFYTSSTSTDDDTWGFDTQVPWLSSSSVSSSSSFPSDSLSSSSISSSAAESTSSSSSSEWWSTFEPSVSSYTSSEVGSTSLVSESLSWSSFWPTETSTSESASPSSSTSTSSKRTKTTKTTRTTSTSHLSSISSASSISSGDSSSSESFVSSSSSEPWTWWTSDTSASASASSTPTDSESSTTTSDEIFSWPTFSESQASSSVSASASVSESAPWGDNGQGKGDDGPTSTITITGTVIETVQVSIESLLTTAPKPTDRARLFPRDRVDVDGLFHTTRRPKDMPPHGTGSPDIPDDDYSDMAASESVSDSDAKGDCIFTTGTGSSGNYNNEVTKAKAMDCLRAMQAHQQKGRSIAFCKNYVAAMSNSQKEKDKGMNVDIDMRIPRYLQSACGTCPTGTLDNDNMKGEGEGEGEGVTGVVDHAMLDEVCKCLMGSSGSGSSSDQSQIGSRGNLVQGVLRHLHLV